MHSDDHYVVRLLSALATRPDDGVMWWRDRTITAFDLVDRALSALDRNASPKIVADWVALNL